MSAEVRPRALSKVTAYGERRELDGSSTFQPFEVLLELNSHRAQPGSCVLDAPDVVQSRWGIGHQCLWPVGEPFMVAGPDGVGKTFIAQHLMLAAAEIRPSELLGLPVAPVVRLLYLACDRPSQAVRSMRRMVSENDRARLDERLVIWRGPLPFDLAGEPEALPAMARRFGCEAVVIDSLKDVAADLSREETGFGMNRALQLCVSEGVDVLALHHQRKAQAGGGKPNKLADVYGSRWLTAGFGSVVMLWGEAGDPVVELIHLKQPDEPVGPFQVVHDHVAGRTKLVDRQDQPDAYTVVTGSTNGVTAAEVAKELFGKDDQNSQEKARRKLQALVADRRLHRQEGTVRGGPQGREPARYFALDLRHQGGPNGE